MKIAQKQTAPKPGSKKAQQLGKVAATAVFVPPNTHVLQIHPIQPRGVQNTGKTNQLDIISIQVSQLDITSAQVHSQVNLTSETNNEQESNTLYDTIVQANLIGAVPNPTVVNKPVQEAQQSQINNTLVLSFKNTYSFTQMIARAQHHYENGELRGGVLGANFDIRTWWVWQTLKCTCLPKHTQNSVECRLELTPAESWLNELITSLDVHSGSEPAYLIAYMCNDDSTFLHEHAHAVYHFSKEYRDIVKELWDSLSAPARSAIEKELVMRGYKPNVYIDEFQAYCLETSSGFGKKWKSELDSVTFALRKLVKRPIIPINLG